MLQWVRNESKQYLCTESSCLLIFKEVVFRLVVTVMVIKQVLVILLHDVKLARSEGYSILLMLSLLF